jgi:DNA-binding NtrC family response regulator
MANKIKLLVVDDELLFLDALCQRLVLRGFEVAKAANGQEALQAARATEFDLVLLDLKMPRMDGKEVLRVLKKEHQHMEVIILTGHGSLDSAAECTRLGAFGYIPKPYELEELIKVLKDAYVARLKKKFQGDQQTMDQILKIAVGESSLEIMRKLHELDAGTR